MGRDAGNARQALMVVLVKPGRGSRSYQSRNSSRAML
jgi:hypothetical protein